MDEVVDPAEEITRFIRSSNDLRPGIGKPRFSAFMPRPPDGDISVYRTSAMTTTEVIDLGDRFVARAGLPLKGYCSLSAQDLFVAGLDVAPAPVPHERHANVRGWTADPANRIVAKKLADKASLVVY